MAKRRRRPPPPDSPDPDERVKFPFGETGSGGDLLEPDSSEDMGSDSQWDASSDDASDSRLPSTPPDADSDDDLDFDTLSQSDSESAPFDASESSDEPLSGDSLEDLVELDSSEARRLSVSDRLGPTNPSGPLVIVDEESDEASSRYQASIVDDSARLAGSASGRQAKKKKTGKKKRSAKQSKWKQEAYDADDSDVPFPEQRRKPRSTSARRPPPRPSKAPLVVVTLLGLLACGGLGAGLEMKRRADLDAQRAAHTEELRAAEQARKDELAAEKARLADELAKKNAQLAKQKEDLESERRAVLAAAEDRIREASQKATAEAEAQAEQAKMAAVAAERERLLREQQATIDVELARAKADADAQEQERVRSAVEDALQRERTASKKVLEAAAAEAEAKRRRQVRELKAELRKEREAAASRAEEDDVATSMAEDQRDLLDDVEGGDGGSVSEGVDDWDEFFEEDGDGDGEDGDEGDGEETGTLHIVEQAYLWVRENIHGKVGYKHLSHFSTGPNRNLRTTRHELRSTLEWRPWLIANDDRSRGLKLVAAADIRHDDDGFYTSVPKSVDDEERRRSTLTPDELSLALTIDWFEIKGGYIVYSWGTGDLFNPTDNLNPIDFSDQFDARRIPVLSATINLDFEYLNLELVSIPSYTRTRLPLRGRRFDTLQTSAVPILRPDDPDPVFENAQWAARASTQIMGWDLSVSGFHGFNDLPEPRFDLLDPSDPSTLVIDPVFDAITVLGGDFATTLGIFGVEGALGEVLNGIQIHGEIAHFWNDSNEVEDYAQYVVGFNYQWVDLIFEHDVQLTIEYAGEFITQKTDNQLAQLQIDRSLRGAVLGRIVYTVNENLSFEINAGVITYGRENALIHPAITWTITDHLQVVLAGDLFFGHSDTFFGQYRRDRRVTTEISILF